MKIQLFLLFIIASTFAQHPALTITIDSIISNDLVSGKRKYIISYTIRNTTSQEISCFLEPKRFSPAHSGSMGTSVLYKLYQNNDPLVIGGILSNPSQMPKFQMPDFSSIKNKDERKNAVKKYLKEHLDIDIDSITIDQDNMMYIFSKQKKLKMKESICVFQSQEIKHFTDDFYWDKKRYYNQDDYEYYLDEKANFYIEFSLVLLKEQYKEMLSKEEYQNIMNNKNFIQGVFSSNRIPINFK